MSPIHFEIDEATHRSLSIRFRLVWRAGAPPRFEALESERHLGLPTGDLTPHKGSADVLLEGAAYARNPGDGRGHVTIAVGAVNRQLVVHGRRVASLHGGRVTFGAAAGFDRMPLDAEHAYGGESAGKHYPRNPIGKGFHLADADVHEVELPNVEEDGDRLTPDRFVATWDAWWRQPQPAQSHAASPLVFPRAALFGLWDWNASSDERLPEVRSGDVPAGFVPRLGAPDPRAAQEAPRRSQLAAWSPGERVVVEGCLPGARAWRTSLPRPPQGKLTIDGVTTGLAASAQTIRLRPEADEICVTYAVDRNLARSFIPGVHARIPIAIEVEREMAAFPTPEAEYMRIRRSWKSRFQGGEP